MKVSLSALHRDDDKGFESKKPVEMNVTLTFCPLVVKSVCLYVCMYKLVITVRHKDQAQQVTDLELQSRLRVN